MPEWSNGPHSKCGVLLRVPWVRIPVSPLKQFETRSFQRVSLFLPFRGFRLRSSQLRLTSPNPMYHRISCLQLLLWSQQIDWSNIHSIISFVGSTNSCQYHRNRLTLPLAVPRGTASCGPRRTIMCPEARDHAPKGNIPIESSHFPI